MSQITSVRIKQESGQYSDRIPIGVLASNVTYNGNNLLQILGENIDIETFGPLKEQIEILQAQTANPVPQGAMINLLNCAETYFNAAYTPKNQRAGIEYQSNRGLYSPEVKTSDGESNAIVCSSFVEAVLNGIPYENSRYVLETGTGTDEDPKRPYENFCYNWGYHFDETGNFGRTVIDEDYENNIQAAETEQEAQVYRNAYEDALNKKAEEAKRHYLTAYELARYAYQHGYARLLDNNSKTAQPGDVIFKRDPSLWPFFPEKNPTITSITQNPYYPTPKAAANNDGKINIGFVSSNLQTAYPTYSSLKNTCHNAGIDLDQCLLSNNMDLDAVFNELKNAIQNLTGTNIQTIKDMYITEESYRNGQTPPLTIEEFNNLGNKKEIRNKIASDRDTIQQYQQIALAQIEVLSDGTATVSIKNYDGTLKSQYYAFLGIDHCAIVLNASNFYYNNKEYCNVFAMQANQGENTHKFDETDHLVGLDFYEGGIGTKSSGYMLSARFPFSDTNIIPELKKSIFNGYGTMSHPEIDGQGQEIVEGGITSKNGHAIQRDPQNNKFYNTILETFSDLPQGFYTITLKGGIRNDLKSSSLNPYIYRQYTSYQNHTDALYFYKNADIYSLVFYMEKPGDVTLRLYKPTSTEDSYDYYYDYIMLFKGYAAPNYIPNENLQTMYLVEYDNLNNKTTPGVYISDSQSITSSLSNKPTDLTLSFRMEIKPLGSNIILQIIYPRTVVSNAYSFQYYRIIHPSSGATAWIKTNDIIGDIFGLNKITTLTATSTAQIDIQNLTNPGIYISSSSTNTANITNKPSEVTRGFRLEIKDIMPSYITTVNNETIIQRKLLYLLEEQGNPGSFFKMIRTVDNLGQVSYTNWFKFSGEEIIPSS